MTNSKIKIAKGWVVISPRGKIKVDTVCVDRESVSLFLDQCDPGSKIVCCQVVVTLKK